MPLNLTARLGAALLLLSALAVPAQALDRALVVGVDSYPFLIEDGVKADRDLEAAVSDATRFARFLIDDWGMDAAQVKLLTDKDATKQAIVDTFTSWLIDATKPGDRVVFYYSGHGFQSIDTDGDEGDDPFDEGLAPHDASGELTEGALDNILIDDEMAVLLKRLAGRDVWIVVDACFSGTITRSIGVADNGRSGGARARTLTPRGPVRARSRGMFSGDAALTRHKAKTRLLSVTADDATKADASSGGLFAWSATSSAQLAFEHSDLGGGVFTSAFIEGLKDRRADFDSDGQVTAAELLTFVRKKSDDFCKSEPICSNGSGLTPEVIAPDVHFTHVLAPPLFSKLNSEPDATGTTTASTPLETADALFSRDNDFETGLILTPGTNLRLGEEILITATSAEPGFLVVFDQDPSGGLRQIFPNEYSQAQAKQGLIGGGGALTIPDPSYGFAFEATEPGTSALLALVTDAQVDFGPLLSENGKFDLIKDPDAFLASLAARLNKPHIGTDPNTPISRHRWAYRTLNYVVR